MRATTIHAPGDIRVSEVPDPTIKLPTDAIVSPSGIAPFASFKAADGSPLAR